jgi:PIN domain nuclease of toxin-antitoxin system
VGGPGGAEVILLDTHVLMWMVTDSKRLARTAGREIHQAQRDPQLCNCLH